MRASYRGISCRENSGLKSKMSDFFNSQNASQCLFNHALTYKPLVEMQGEGGFFVEKFYKAASFRAQHPGMSI